MVIDMLILSGIIGAFYTIKCVRDYFIMLWVQDTSKYLKDLQRISESLPFFELKDYIIVKQVVEGENIEDIDVSKKIIEDIQSNSKRYLLIYSKLRENGRLQIVRRQRMSRVKSYITRETYKSIFIPFEKYREIEERLAHKLKYDSYADSIRIHGVIECRELGGNSEAKVYRGSMDFEDTILKLFSQKELDAAWCD